MPIFGVIQNYSQTHGKKLRELTMPILGVDTEVWKRCHLFAVIHLKHAVSLVFTLTANYPALCNTL